MLQKVMLGFVVAVGGVLFTAGLPNIQCVNEASFESIETRMLDGEEIVSEIVISDDNGEIREFFFDDAYGEDGRWLKLPHLTDPSGPESKAIRTFLGYRKFIEQHPEAAMKGIEPPAINLKHTRLPSIWWDKVEWGDSGADEVYMPTEPTAEQRIERLEAMIESLTDGGLL